MLKVGLTGSIAVGKSYVLSLLGKLGCYTFDADKIARQVVEPGAEGHRRIVAEFGEDVLTPDGSIDRAKLGQIVFADKEKRELLNRLIHPLVIAEQDRLMKAIEARDPEAIVVVDAALMIESGGYRRFDKIIVVFCDREVQISRLMQRNGLTREEALQRINAQMSSEEKRRYADYEIDTSNGFEDTYCQVEQVHAKLLDEATDHKGKR